MSATSRSKRRWFGGICLGVAILMLIAGQTFLKSWLAESAVWLICFWLGCFLFTALAAGAALLDAARVGLESRKEQRSLIEDTLRDVEREKQARNRDKN